MIFTRERKNNRKNRKTISFVMFSGGKKMGPLARNGLDTITVQSGKMGKEYTELKKKKKKKKTTHIISLSLIFELDQPFRLIRDSG